MTTPLSGSPGIAYVTYEKPFNSVVADLVKLDKRAGSGVYVMPVLGVFLAALLLTGFFVLLFSKNVPWQLLVGFLVGFTVLLAVTIYAFRQLKRYQVTRAALRVWSEAHGFAAVGPAYVGIAKGRRCAITAHYRRRAENDYVFEGFAFVIQLTDYSAGGVNVLQKPHTGAEAGQLLDWGHQLLLERYLG